MKQPCVYKLASQRNGTILVGVMSDQVKRVWEHKQDSADGFTKYIACIPWCGLKCMKT